MIGGFIVFMVFVGLPILSMIGIILFDSMF